MLMIFSTNKTYRPDITKIDRFTKPVVMYPIDPINPKPFENRVLVIIIVIRMFQGYTVTYGELSFVYYTPPHKTKTKSYL